MLNSYTPGLFPVSAYSQYGARRQDYALPSGALIASPDGLNSAPCTLSQPGSLQRAMSMAAKGQTIALLGGTYRTSHFDGRIARTMTLQPYREAQVVLKGSELCNTWLPDGKLFKTFWNTLFPHQYTPEMRTRTVTSENPMADNRDMVFINGAKLRQVSAKSQVDGKSFWVDYAKKEIYIGFNPAGQMVEITASQWGLHTYNVKDEDITVRGLTFAHYAECGLMLQSDNINCEHNVFVDNAIAGIKVYFAKNPCLRFNTFARNGLHGVGANRCESIQFYGNVLLHNNSEKFNRNSWSAAGIKILRSPQSQVNSNWVEGNDANGIWLDEDSHQSTVLANVLHNNTRNGIFIEVSHDCIAAGNIVTGSGKNAEKLLGAGICVGESANTQVLHNTLLDNEVNLAVVEIDRTGMFGADYKTRNTTILNNIFYNATLSEFPQAQVWLKKRKSADALVKEMDGNLYYKTNINQPALLLRMSVGDGNTAIPERHADIDSIRTAFGYEKAGQEYFGDEDPLFAADYRQAGSSSAGTGRYHQDYGQIKSGSFANKTAPAIATNALQLLGWQTGQVAYEPGARQNTHAKVSPPSSGQLPWIENFALANGSTSDDGKNGGTAWSLERDKIFKSGVFQINNNRLMAKGTGPVAFISEELTVQHKANISLSFSSKGNMRNTDGIQVYLRKDAGAAELLHEITGNIAGVQTVTFTNVAASKLQIIVRFRVANYAEEYYLHNVTLNPVAAPAVELPWAEDFSQALKGTLTQPQKPDAIFKVITGNANDAHLLAENTGEAVYATPELELGAISKVQFSLNAGSKGVLQPTDEIIVAYRLNGGPEEIEKVIKGNIKGRMFVRSGVLLCSKLQVICRFRTNSPGKQQHLFDVRVFNA